MDHQSATAHSLGFSGEWVQSLPEAERLELIRLLTPKLTPYIPRQPTVPQTAFLLLPNREALYGGAAGGGKSEALLMGALQYVDVPGYSAIIFRRRHTDLMLPGALIPRSHEWLAGTDARWNGQDKCWTFPSGATLSFGYLEHEDDKYRYQGAELQFIAFDELTQFAESQYLYLLSRLRRREGHAVPLRMRASANPGGKGHEWVKTRFVDASTRSDRMFVPAKLEDNPHLDQAAYRESLAQLSAVEREQLLSGNWDVRPKGPLFERGWFEVVEAVPDGLRKARYWDLAATPERPGKDPDWTVGVLLGEKDGLYYLLDVRRVRKAPAGVEELVWQTALLDGNRTAIGMEQEPGSSGVNTVDHYARNVLKGCNFKGTRPTGSKVERAEGWARAAERRNIKVVRGPWLKEWLDEVEAFPFGGHDDQVDATSGAFEMLGRPRIVVR